MDNKELSSSLSSVVSALHKTLRKQSFPNQIYSMTEMETIGYLMRNEKLLPSELAKLTRIKTQSVSQIINKMEQLNVVKRTPSKEDKRKVYVSLTAKAYKMVDKMRDERSEWLKTTIEKALNEKEKKQLEKIIPVLNKLITIKN